MKFLCFSNNVPDDGGGNRKTTQIIVALLATLSVFNASLHVGWPTPSLPKILSSEYPFDVSDDEASNILVVGYLGDIVGGVLSCCLFDRIGRQKTLMVVSIPQILSFLFIYLSFYSKILLYLGRVFGGISEGAIFGLCAMYLSEIVEPDIRGRVGSLAPIFVQTAIIAINIVGTFLSLYTTAALCVAFPILFLVLFWKMPETPYFYLMKNKPEEAEKVLKYLLNKEKVEKELSVLKEDVKRQMSESGTFKDLFVINSNRKALFLTIVARIVQQFSGCTAFGLYAQILMKNSISFLSPLAGSTLMLLIQLIMVFFSISMVDKYGRKPLLIFSSVGCLTANVLSGIYFTLRDHTCVDMGPYEFLPLIFIICYQVLFSAGLQPLVNIINSEMFSASIKSRAFVFLNITFAITALSSLKYYQFMADNVGLAIPFYTFALITFAGTLVFIFMLPETKGKRLEEIQQELKGNKISDKDVTVC